MTSRPSSPPPVGCGPTSCCDVFEAVAADCELVGLEVTAFHAPEDELERQADASVVLGAIEPLLEAIPEGERVRG